MSSNLPLGQLFTVRDGVQKPLAEMNAAEVVAAIAWNDEKMARAVHASIPAEQLYNAIEQDLGHPLGEGEPDEDFPIITATLNRLGKTQDDLGAAVTALTECGEQEVALASLLRQVNAGLPAWQRKPGMSLANAVRRFWPR